MSKFENTKKKYALSNSYFKNRRSADPANPFEVIEYVKQHDELPYNAKLTENWFYDCFVEYQKRAGVVNDQFFTPPQTAQRIAEIAFNYSNSTEIRLLDACCGFGILSRALYDNNVSYNIDAFDLDEKLIDAADTLNYGIASNRLNFFKDDFLEPKRLTCKYDMIVSNPPYDGKLLIEFFEFLHEYLYEGGIAVLLLPCGFLDKRRPERLVKALNNFYIEKREQMVGKFARTGAKAEIVVLIK